MFSEVNENNENGSEIKDDNDDKSEDEKDLGKGIVSITEYEFTLVKTRMIFKVIVKDTKPPVFSGEDSHTITEGDSFDLKDKIKAEDLVDGEVEITFSDYKLTVGEHKVTATAKDKHDNEATRKITIIVKAKAVEPVLSATPPTSGGNSGNTGGGNNEYTPPTIGGAGGEALIAMVELLPLHHKQVDVR